MSQNSLVLPTTGTVSGLQMTVDTNAALDTLNTLASGPSAPPSPEAGQLWHDTTNNLLKLRDDSNASWIPFLSLSQSALAAFPFLTSQISGSAQRLLNADMRVDQVNEGASYSIAVNNTRTYATDQWFAQCLSSGASGVSAQRIADAPLGFVNSLKVTVGTGAGSVGAGEFLYLAQPIEGQNVADFAYGGTSAIASSLSFWVKSSITGTFAATLQNGSGLRANVNKFSITSANTWQLITIPNIAGDQSGTWATDNTAGIYLIITLATGTTYQSSTLNAFVAGGFLGSTTQSNGVLTTSGATFQITGVQLNPGPFCLPFEKRNAQQELAGLQRYFYKTFINGTAVAQNAGTAGALASIQGYGAAAANQASNDLRFPVQMRASPTVITYNPAATNAQFRNQVRAADASSISPNIQSQNNWSFTYTTASGSAAGDGNAVHLTANARM